ncbi:11S globulin seed storage protein 2-like [Triticum dicoccoides]|uniref:11S globulin seed storage protein 2-like n=1 Tax=Triticum dicoccoides TaxID=85692 RepID=UPI00189196E9|nr:11S globulin seed storage protein 2-like [Triticum dicoccoides]
MAVDLTPRQPAKAYGGEGGAYYEWSPAELPMLGVASIGAAKLSLAAGGMSLPSYSDSAKVAYVLQGMCMQPIHLDDSIADTQTPNLLPHLMPILGIFKRCAVTIEGISHRTRGLRYPKRIAEVSPEYQTLYSFFKIKKSTDTYGIRIGLYRGSIRVSGQYPSIGAGFSTEFVGRAWDLKQDAAAKLVSSQPASGIVKLSAGQKLPEPVAEDRKDMALNCLEAKLDVDIPKGGRVVVLNTANLPLVKEVGLGADLVRIDAHSMCSPGFSCDSAYQVTYIVRGSGRVQVVGPDGKRVLETRIEGGSLFIVPRFHVVSKIADASGMEWFSIITTPNPIFSHLAGKTSVWKAISPEVLEASFNTTPEMEKLFRSKRLDSEIFFAPN